MSDRQSETSFTARDDGGFDQSEQPEEGDENPRRSRRLQPPAPEQAPEPAPSKATGSAAKKAKGKKSQGPQEQPEEEIQPEEVEQPR